MKNYLNFETEIKDLETELEKLKDPYNQEGLTEVDTQKISSTQVELDKKFCFWSIFVTSNHSSLPRIEIRVNIF